MNSFTLAQHLQDDYRRFTWTAYPVADRGCANGWRPWSMIRPYCGAASTSPCSGRPRRGTLAELVADEAMPPELPEGFPQLDVLFDRQEQAARRLWQGRHTLVATGTWFQVAGEPVAVWSIYTDPARTVLAINFEWMHRGGKAVPEPALEHLADRLRPLPGVAGLYADLAARNYKKRPSIPANQLFTADDAAARIIEAIDELVGSGTPAASHLQLLDSLKKPCGIRHRDHVPGRPVRGPPPDPRPSGRAR